jgi:O-antigen/teichoic acid export membrane protein
VALLGMLAGGAGAYTIIHATFTLKTRAREAAFELPRERYREILAYASPFIVWGLSGWIYLSVDRWCAGLVLGVEGVGLLAVVSQVAMYPLAFGSGFLSSLFMPIAFQKAGALTDRAAIGKAISIPLISACAFAAGAAILAAIFGVWHREVIILLSRTRYTALSSLLPVMTLAWAMFFLAQAITQCGQVLNNTKAFMVPKSASTLLMGLCTYGMARVYGAEGIAWGMLTGGAVYVLWTGGVVWQLLRRERVWQMALH